MPATTPSSSHRFRSSVERAEQQRVEQRDRARAHRDDVAHDAADAGRRALVGLDRARVRVRLDLEHGGDAVADVDGAGVLPGADEHGRALGRQRAQVDLRGLVRAVLRPHRRVHRELGPVRARGRGSHGSARARRRAGPSCRCRGSSTATVSDPRHARRPAATRTAAGRRWARRRDRRRARDAASARPRCRRSLRTPGDVREGAVGVVGVVDRAVGRGVAEHDPALALQTRRARPADATNCPSPCLIGTSRISPGTSPPVTGALRGLHAQVHAPADEPQRPVADQRARAAGPTRRGSGSRCRCPAPGRRASANARTSSITAREPRDRAAPQVVAVAESARQDDGVDVVEVRSACQSGDAVAAHRLDGAQRVAVVQRAGERDDADARPRAVLTPRRLASTIR